MKRLFFICTSILVFFALTSGAFAGETTSKSGITTFTMFVAETSSVNDNGKSEVAEVIAEKTGVKLAMEFIVGDAQQKLTVMLASGDYPDFIYPKGDGPKFVEAGALLDLTDLIEEYGPNIKKHYGKYLPRHRFSEEDPGIYWLGSFGVDDANLFPGSGHQVQQAVLKELGCPKVRTVKDFEKVVRDYYELHPTIDGKPTIPYTLCADGWRIMISVTNTAVFATGGNGDDGEYFVDFDTYDTVIHHTRPEEKEYFRWLNHMYNEGLLDQEFATQKYDTYVEKITSGRVLGLSTAWWEILSAEESLERAGREERKYTFFPVTLDERYEHKAFMQGGYVPNYGIGITTSCKDPVKAIKFFDWMCTEEAQILRYWGIEGKHWIIDENDKRVWTEEYRTIKETDPDVKKRTGIGLYTYPFPEVGRGTRDSGGHLFQPETSIDSIIAEYSDFEKEILACYGAKANLDLWKIDWPVKPWGNAWQLTTVSYTHLRAHET